MQQLPASSSLNRTSCLYARRQMCVVRSFQKCGEGGPPGRIAALSGLGMSGVKQTHAEFMTAILPVYPMGTPDRLLRLSK